MHKTIGKDFLLFCCVDELLTSLFASNFYFQQKGPLVQPNQEIRASASAWRKGSKSDVPVQNQLEIPTDRASVNSTQSDAYPASARSLFRSAKLETIDDCPSTYVPSVIGTVAVTIIPCEKYNRKELSLGMYFFY